MFINNYEITIDIKKAFTKKIPFYVNDDNASITFTVLDNGNHIDLSVFNKAVIRHRLQSSEVLEIIGNINIDENSVTYFLDKKIVANKGEVRLILSLHTETTRISTQPFKINII